MKKIFLIIALLISTISFAQSTHGVETWRSNKTYSTNKLVSKDGVIYKANTTTTQTPPNTEWDVYGGSSNLNNQFNINANYTPLLANRDGKGIIQSGNITLDDAGLPVEYQLTLLNNSGGDITIDKASGQNVLNSQTVPQTLSDGMYAYLEIVADNTWSIIVGSSDSGGIAPTIVDKNSNYTTDVSENGYTLYFSAGSTITLDSSGLPIGFAQTVFNSTGSSITVSSSQAIEGGNTTILDGTWAVYQLQATGNWLLSTQAAGGSIQNIQTKTTNYTTDNSENGDIIYATGGTTLTLDDTGLSAGFNQTYFNSTGSDVTVSSSDNVEGGSTTILDGTWAVYILQSNGNWLLSTQAVGIGGSETDPVFIAWDKSTGISITESQISDFGSYLQSLSQDISPTLSTDLNGNEKKLLNFYELYLEYIGGGPKLRLHPEELEITVASDFTFKGVDFLLDRTISQINAAGANSLMTSEAVDARITASGGGDMLKTTYDTNDDNAVDNAEALGGQPASNFARTDIATTFSGDITIDNGLGTVLETDTESPTTSGLYLLSAPNNFSGHVLNADGSAVDLGRVVPNIDTTELLYGLNFETEQTSNFSVATVSVKNNQWYELNHASTDITVTLDQGVKGRVVYFEQKGDAQGIFVAGTGVTLSYPVSITTPKTKEKGVVVAAIWKSATLVQLVGALEDN